MKFKVGDEIKINPKSGKEYFTTWFRKAICRVIEIPNSTQIRCEIVKAEESVGDRFIENEKYFTISKVKSWKERVTK